MLYHLAAVSVSARPLQTSSGHRLVSCQPSDWALIYTWHANNTAGQDQAYQEHIEFKASQSQCLSQSKNKAHCRCLYLYCFWYHPHKNTKVRSANGTGHVYFVILLTFSKRQVKLLNDLPPEKRLVLGNNFKSVFLFPSQMTAQLDDQQHCISWSPVMVRQMVTPWCACVCVCVRLLLQMATPQTTSSSTGREASRL